MNMINALGIVVLAHRASRRAMDVAGQGGVLMRPEGRVTIGWKGGRTETLNRYTVMRAEEPGAERFAFRSILTRGGVWGVAQPDATSGDIEMGFYEVRRLVE